MDTLTGEILLERALEIGERGGLRQKMFCDDETPVAVVEEDDRFHLFDPCGGRVAALIKDGYELTPPHTKNCKALASRTSADDPAQLEYTLYDIAAAVVESEFVSPAPARNILFAGGSRWLRQLAQDPAAVLREAELDVPGGALIEEMQCDADTPRAIIAGPRRIWLLDAETLSVVAENETPFERDYFVFE